MGFGEGKTLAFVAEVLVGSSGGGGIKKTAEPRRKQLSRESSGSYDVVSNLVL